MSILQISDFQLFYPNLINEDESFTAGPGMPFRDGAEVLGEDFYEAYGTSGGRYAQVVDLYLIVLRIHGIVHPSDRHEVLTVF